MQPLKTIPEISEPVSPLKKLITGFVILSLLVGGIGCWQLLNTRDQAMKSAFKDGTALSELLSHAIVAMIQESDIAVINIIDDVVAKQAPKDELKRTVERQIKLIPELDSLRISDANGTIIINSGSSLDVPINVADLEYFIYLKNNPQAGLFITKTIIGRVTKKQIIGCARRITLADGSFGGVVIAALSLQQIKDLFKNVPTGSRGSVSLRGIDFSLITRVSPSSVADEAEVGSTSISKHWKDKLQQGNTKSGTYITRMVRDNIERIYTYRQIPPYSLYVNVGLAMDDVMSEARKDTFISVCAFCLILLLEYLLALLIYRHWQKTVAAETNLRDMQLQMMQNDKLASIGLLAAGVAHEINNPVGFIGSNIETLADYSEKYNRYIDRLEQEICTYSGGMLPDSIQDLYEALNLDYVAKDIAVLIEQSNAGIERVKHIVQDLKTFPRTDTSSTGLADLNRCIDSTTNIVFNEINGIAEFERQYGDLPTVTCNIQQISQVFMNLVVNAAQSIQEKGVVRGMITIKTWCDENRVFVAVTDNGCGIPPENMKKLFDAFYTTKDVGRGTGLGLSISADIIRKHGGEILVESVVGEGATFTVCLPIK